MKKNYSGLKIKNKGSNVKPLIILISLVLIFSFSSCATKIAKSVDPQKAIYELAPVQRNAFSPSNGVYYCVFVRAFADSNGDGVGDFKGLIEKLDYLNDGNDLTTTDLGITGIWLMPIFPSQTYHGYNVDDYYDTNPSYGSLDDFKLLVKEANKRGIDIIIDMTCNHSSTYTDWFIESRQPDSHYRDWYRWIEEDDPKYNLKQRIWGHYVWNKSTGGSYYAGLFESGMPDFNLANPEVRQEFKNIATYWLDIGLAGFRFDAASHIFNASKIPAGEDGQSQAVAFWKELVEHIHSVREDAYTVGEVWEQTSTRGRYMQGLDSTFHFDLGTKIIDAVKAGTGGKNNLANSLYFDLERYSEYNPDYIDAPFISNHDQNRFAGLLRADPELIKLAASLYILAEGVPFMYYGEEIGLQGAKPDQQLRTPMLWDAPGKDKLQTTWIESKYNKNTIPVARQQKDKNSLLNYYKRIIRLKTQHSALFEGRLKPLWTEKSEMVSWVMESDKQKVFVMFNLSDEVVEFVIPSDITKEDFSLIFASHNEVNLLDKNLTMPARSTVVVEFN